MNMRKNAQPSHHGQPLSPSSPERFSSTPSSQMSDYQHSLMENLSSAHYQILLLVHQLTLPEEGLSRVPLSDIVHRTGIPRTVVLHQVEALATLGLLRKMLDTDEDSRVFLRLTLAGRHLLALL